MPLALDALPIDILAGILLHLEYEYCTAARCTCSAIQATTSTAEFRREWLSIWEQSYSEARKKRHERLEIQRLRRLSESFSSLDSEVLETSEPAHSEPAGRSRPRCPPRQQQPLTTCAPRQQQPLTTSDSLAAWRAHFAVLDAEELETESSDETSQEAG